MKHLQEIVLPVFKRNILTTSICFDLLVSSLTNLIISSSTQNINQQSKTYLLLSTQNGGKSFLYQYRTVETLRRILANITVVTIMIHRFAEIIKQNSTATYQTLCIPLAEYPLRTSSERFGRSNEETNTFDSPFSSLARRNC